MSTEDAFYVTESKLRIADTGHNRLGRFKVWVALFTVASTSLPLASKHKQGESTSYD